MFIIMFPIEVVILGYAPFLDRRSRQIVSYSISREELIPKKCELYLINIPFISPTKMLSRHAMLVRNLYPFSRFD